MIELSNSSLANAYSNSFMEEAIIRSKYNAVSGFAVVASNAIGTASKAVVYANVACTVVMYIHYIGLKQSAISFLWWNLDRSLT